METIAVGGEAQSRPMEPDYNVTRLNQDGSSTVSEAAVRIEQSVRTIQGCELSARIICALLDLSSQKALMCM
jgi:hypothetical protein